MPRKRAAGGVRLTLADLSFNERFAFIGSWWRPGSARRGVADTRWRSWREYFDAYAAVRSALLAGRTDYWPPFAELAWPLFQADAARFDPDAASELYDAGRTAYATRAPSGGRKAVV